MLFGYSRNVLFCSDAKLTRANHRSGRTGSVLTLVVAALLVSAVVAGVMWIMTDADSSGQTKALLHEVGRSDFELTVVERGEFEAAGVTEVRSEVKTLNNPGLAILRVVDEGTIVKAGDFMLELDASALEAERVLQQNLVNLADAAVVETRNLYETALIAKQEYIDGTYVQERQTIESEAFVAEENLNRAKEYYQFSQRLAAKGHINQLQLEADRFAVDKAAKELEVANTKLRVIDNFTKAKMSKQLESDVVITEAKWGAAKKNYELELESLREIDDQIAKCTIYAPKDGVVIYANDINRRGGDDWVVEEGAIVRERQVVFRLPDSGAMRVELKVNESLIQYVKEGMPATIYPIGLDDVELYGKVSSVSRYAEPGNWRKADVKEYSSFVTVAEGAAGLRSGMTASVTIKCDFVADAIQVPVQAIHPHGDDFYCLVYEAGNWEPRKVVCGPTNSEYFVIESGLDAGDRVSLNPRAYVAEVSLPEIPAKVPKLRDGPPAEPAEAVAENSATTETGTTKAATTETAAAEVASATQTTTKAETPGDTPTTTVPVATDPEPDATSSSDGAAA